MTSSSLHQRISALRQRLLLIGLAVSVGWGAVALIGLVLLFMWLDLVIELPPAARIACGIAAIGLGIVIGARLAWGAWRGGAPAAIARRLDRVTGSVGQILAGVDLLLHPVPATARSGAASLTAGMARLAIDRAASLAAAVPASRVVPNRPIYHPAATLLGVLVLIGGVAIAIPRLASTQWLRFTDPYGDHPPYSRIELTVQPGDAKVVYGGTLDIRAKASDETVDHMDLVVKPQDAAEEALPMFPESGGNWRGTLTRLTANAQYFVRAHGARSHRYDIGIVTVPKLQSVRFRITPPAYTHRPPIEGPAPATGLAALPGTLIEVWAKSNRPLSGGAVSSDTSQDVGPAGAGAPASQPTSRPGAAATRPTSATSFSLAPSGGEAEEVNGSFVVRSAGSLSVLVTDVAGQNSTEPFTVPLTLLRDERPFVRVLQPKPDSYATPDVTLNIELAAEDDYGISKLQLFRGLNESVVRGTDVPVPANQPARFTASVPLPLGDYAVDAGDVIKLYAHVEDNDPAGAKGSESPIVTIHIISKEQMQEMMLAREGLETFLSKYEQATRRMEAAQKQMDELRKQLENADPKSPLSKELHDKLQKLAEQMQGDADELQKLAGEDLPFDLDKALRGQLKGAADKMQRAASAMKQLADKPQESDADAAAAIADAQKKLDEERGQYKKQAADPLDHLAKTFPLIEDQARFVELYQRQRDLEQRMQELRTHDKDDNPSVKARMRDLEEEQRQLHQDFRQLMDDIDNHIAQLPPDERLNELRESATEFSKAVRASPIGQQMSDSESGLAEFDGTKAAQSARAAADTMESFIARGQSVGDKAGQCMGFQPELSAGLGNTVEQLLNAEGLGTKPGQGSGSGGGYSARRSSLRNVGLYGHIPTRGGDARSGGGHNGRGAGSDAHGEPTPGDASDAEGNHTLSASGQSDAAVPDRYKRRVGEYFQRVSDELDQSDKK